MLNFVHVANLCGVLDGDLAGEFKRVALVAGLHLAIGNNAELADLYDKLRTSSLPSSSPVQGQPVRSV